jgi:hypothetical protein
VFGFRTLYRYYNADKVSINSTSLRVFGGVSFRTNTLGNFLESESADYADQRDGADGRSPDLLCAHHNLGKQIDPAVQDQRKCTRTRDYTAILVAV